jgi:hypothetical protein
MLCDELYESHTGKVGAYFKYDKEGIGSLCRKFIEAHKFVVSDDAYEMARHIREQKPSSMLESMNFARPPFPLTWIEYSSSAKRDSNIDDLRTEAEAPRTKKIGFLVEEKSENELLISMGYSFRDSSLPPIMSILSYVYDKKKGAEMMEELINLGSGIKVDPSTYMKAQDAKISEWVETLSSHELEAAKKIGEMFVPFPFPHYMNTMYEGGKLDQKIMVQSMQSAAADWIGETLFPQLFFILMNCKNAVEIQDHENIEALNKKRIRNGKLALFDHKTIVLTNKLKAAIREDGETDEHVRMHWRRGHFKIRKTGVYWWSPHLAGRKELGMIEKDYVL